MAGCGLGSCGQADLSSGGQLLFPCQSSLWCCALHFCAEDCVAIAALLGRAAAEVHSHAHDFADVLKENRWQDLSDRTLEKGPSNMPDSTTAVL